MSEKDKEDFSPTEDYLAQVEWQARDRHRSIGGIFSFSFLA